MDGDPAARFRPDRIGCGVRLSAETVERPDFEDVVERYYRRWDLTHSEDNEICELQQSGITSPLAQAGRLARRERGVHPVDFWVVKQLLGGSEDDSRAAAE